MVRIMLYNNVIVKTGKISIKLRGCMHAFKYWTGNKVAVVSNYSVSDGHVYINVNNAVYEAEPERIMACSGMAIDGILLYEGDILSILGDKHAEEREVIHNKAANVFLVGKTLLCKYLSSHPEAEYVCNKYEREAMRAPSVIKAPAKTPAPAPAVKAAISATDPFTADLAEDAIVAYIASSQVSAQGIAPDSGWAVTVYASGKEKRTSAFMPGATGNRAALVALYETLKATPKGANISVYASNSYIISPFEKGWLKNWIACGWLKSGSEPVQNKDIWEKVEPLTRTRHVAFFWQGKKDADTMHRECMMLAQETLDNRGKIKAIA